MERYIAVDNVCAWPNLTKMADGAIVAAIFNQPTHGGWEGDVECWISGDAGFTWKYRGTPAPHEPGTNRMNVAAGTSRSGNLVVIASGWSRREPPGNYTPPHEGEILQPWVCRSKDEGRTWERSKMDIRRMTPFGDIVQLADGNLGVCFYCESENGDCTSFFYTSPDDGLTWQERSCIRATDINETTPLVLPGGSLLAAGRTGHDHHLDLFLSGDNGISWRERERLTFEGQHPGHLLLLKDGRIILTFGMRNAGLFGVGARTSMDGGKTWTGARVIVNYTPDRGSVDGGYPSSIETAEGTVVTAYYCSRVNAHQRYHMGVVRWKPE